MSLIKSISGIRGTIGGVPGDGLSPLDVVRFTAAYARFISENTTRKSRTIVVGRDARLSGPMVFDLVAGTLTGMGFDVVNIGMATTPTTEIAVTMEKACGGIIITASHNPKQWNALKLLNENGEFLNDAQGKEVLRIAAEDNYTFADVDSLGHVFTNDTYGAKHIDAVPGLNLVDVEAIRNAGFTVAVDAVNSIGGVVIPQLLRALGVKNIIELNCEATGKFAHTPEPIPENLTQISQLLLEGSRRICSRGRGRLCASAHSRFHSLQSELFTCVARRYPCPWLFLLGGRCGRGQCRSQDEGDRSRHRRRGQWRCHLSRTSLWPRRIGRRGFVPDSSRQERKEGGELRDYHRHRRCED